MYVAWTHGTRLRFTRFSVGAAPGASMTALPTLTIEDTTSQSSPRMAAAGKRVVIAWERKGSVVARVSTDTGESFKARRTVFQGAPSTGKVAFVTNADALGATLIVSGAVSSEGITVRSGVRRTTNGGASWATVGPEKTGGFVVGILGGASSAPRLHLVWDERFKAEPHEIRAQYLDLG